MVRPHMMGAAAVALRTATNPQTGERVAFVMGEWVPYRPDQTAPADQTAPTTPKTANVHRHPIPSTWIGEVAPLISTAAR